MEKVKKFIPDKVSVAGSRIILGEKDLNNLVSIVNAQTDTINALIDIVEKHSSCEAKLTKAVSKLAKALKTYMED